MDIEALSKRLADEMLWALPEEQFQEGRAILYSGDLERFAEWLQTSQVMIDHTVVLDTFRVIFLAGDLEKARVLYDRTFAGIVCSPLYKAVLAAERHMDGA